MFPRAACRPPGRCACLDLAGWLQSHRCSQPHHESQRCLSTRIRCGRCNRYPVTDLPTAALLICPRGPACRWWQYPDDPSAVGVNTQYMLGPDYLVAPVVDQNATNRTVVKRHTMGQHCCSALSIRADSEENRGHFQYFPGDTSTKWFQVFDGTVVHGGQAIVVQAPLDIIPVYTTRRDRMLKLL